MYTDGYIKLSRKLLEWGWYKDKNTLILFLHLLLTANYKQCKYLDMTINRGQLITGRKKLCDELDLSEQEIRTALNHLKSTNEITIKPTSKFSIITILNYDEYLSPTSNLTNNLTSDHLASNQQVTDYQPTSNQQSTSYQPHINKYNKDNKYNNYNKARNTRTGDMYELSDYEIERFRSKILYND